MRALVAEHNALHETIDRLDAATGYVGQLRALINAAETRGRLPRAELINRLADELHPDVRPVEVLLAFARDAGVRMPPSVNTTSVWHRMLNLPVEQREALVDALDSILTLLEQMRAEQSPAEQDGGE